MSQINLAPLSGLLLLLLLWGGVFVFVFFGGGLGVGDRVSDGALAGLEFLM